MNKISEDPLMLGSTYLSYRYRLKYKLIKILGLFPLFSVDLFNIVLQFRVCSISS